MITIGARQGSGKSGLTLTKESETSYPVLVSLHLLRQGIHAQVGSFFEGAALLAHDDVVTGYVKFDLDDLVLGVAGFVEFQKDFSSDDIVIKRDHLIDFLLDEVDQLSVCIEMDGLDSDLHGVSSYGLCPRMGVLVHFFQFLDRVVRVDLGGTQVGMTEQFFDTVYIGAVVEHVGRERVA
jgi:hypothetical protein